MLSLTTTTLLSLLPLLTSAHFHLQFPTARGSDDTNQATFPCGGYNDVLSNRTVVSLSALPISMELGHSTNLISVFLAVGNEPGENFTVQLQPTADEEGPGVFCWQGLSLPEGSGIVAGTNATLQVITNGHAGNGLYSCADITFTEDAAVAKQPESCTNGTGITAEFAAAGVLANTTEGEHEHGDNATESASGAASSASASATSATSAGGAAIATAAGWGVIGAGVMGAVALL